MIPESVVDDLCRLGALGESESAAAQAILKRLAPQSRVNRMRPEVWNTVADGLDISRLINLIQGLVLAEEALGWRGSTSGVIWTFHVLMKRDEAGARLVAVWGADKSTNEYVGFSNRGRQIHEAWAARKRAARDRIEWEQAEAAQRRLERSESVKQHMEAAARNAQERAEFLSTLADLPLADRLHNCAMNRNRPLSWFPDTWAIEAIGAVPTFDTSLRDELIERLAGWRKGPWKRLHDALVAARDNTHDSTFIDVQTSR